MNWYTSNSSYLVQTKPKLLQSENSYWLLSENLSEDASQIIFIVATSPIVCDVGSSVSAFPADVLDQQEHMNEETERLNKLVDWYKFKLDEIREAPADSSSPTKLSRLYQISEKNKHLGVTITRAGKLSGKLSKISPRIEIT